MDKTKKIKIFDNAGFYLLLGIILAILVARGYVYFGGDLGLGYDGITFHHIFLGIILVLLSGITFFSFNSFLSKRKQAMNLLAFIFGFGTGLITDETNFLVSAGEYYNLSNYYQPLNVYVDVIFIILTFSLFIYSIFRRNR